MRENPPFEPETPDAITTTDAAQAVPQDWVGRLKWVTWLVPLVAAFYTMRRASVEPEPMLAIAWALASAFLCWVWFAATTLTARLGIWEKHGEEIMKASERQQKRKHRTAYEAFRRIVDNRKHGWDGTVRAEVMNDRIATELMGLKIGYDAGEKVYYEDNPPSRGGLTYYQTRHFTPTTDVVLWEETMPDEIKRQGLWRIYCAELAKLGAMVHNASPLTKSRALCRTLEEQAMNLLDEQD